MERKKTRRPPSMNTHIGPNDLEQFSSEVQQLINAAVEGMANRLTGRFLRHGRAILNGRRRPLRGFEE